jgi:DNA polymerase-3 subunit epsilon
MHKPNYAYLDLETTGTDVTKHGVHQIALSLQCGSEWTELNYKVRPREGCMVSPEALEIAGVTIEQLKEYQPMRAVYDDLTSRLGRFCDKFDKSDKYFVVAYNASFDTDFLRQFFLDCGDKYYGSWFWHPPLCVMQMAAERLVDQRPTMPNFKLMTVAKQFGFEVDESRLHEAGYDLLLTRQLFENFTSASASVAA